MKATITIEVKDQQQADHIAKGLENESMRGLAAIIGILSDLYPAEAKDVLDMAMAMKFDKGRH